MAEIRIPPVLRPDAAGNRTVAVEAGTVREALTTLVSMHPALESRLLAGGVVASFLAVTLISSFSVTALAEDSIPRLGFRDSGWNANFWDFQLDPPVGSGHGPMKTDPKYPYTSQCQNGGCFGGRDLRPPIVDTKDPILKPWAAEQMQAELLETSPTLH